MPHFLVTLTLLAFDDTMTLNNSFPQIIIIHK